MFVSISAESVEFQVELQKELNLMFQSLTEDKKTLNVKLESMESYSHFSQQAIIIYQKNLDHCPHQRN